MCSRCKKRVAVVFMTRLEDGKRINDGVCMKCAQEMGLPLGNLLGDYMNKMGVSPEQLVEMEDGIADMLENGETDPEAVEILKARVLELKHENDAIEAEKARKKALI